MGKIKSAEELVKKVNDFKNKDQIDLSLGEDLSIALMNLISIEEHLYFSGIKTNKRKYFELLNSIGELRKKLLKEIVKEPEGEEWCISKHLLAASMRLIEVGNKHLRKNEEQKAYKRFQEAFELYLLFWSINLKQMKNEEMVGIQKGSKIQIIKNKVKDTLKKIIDCCKE